MSSDSNNTGVTENVAHLRSHLSSLKERWRKAQVKTLVTASDAYHAERVRNERNEGNLTEFLHLLDLHEEAVRDEKRLEVDIALTESQIARALAIADYKILLDGGMYDGDDVDMVNRLAAFG